MEDVPSVLLGPWRHCPTPCQVTNMVQAFEMKFLEASFGGGGGFLGFPRRTDLLCRGSRGERTDTPVLAQGTAVRWVLPGSWERSDLFPGRHVPVGAASAAREAGRRVGKGPPGREWWGHEWVGDGMNAPKPLPANR